MRARLVGALMLVTALALAGCARNDGDGIASANPGRNDSADAAATMSPEESAFKFAECMRDHGVDMPDPQVDGAGGFGVNINGEDQELSREGVDAAFEACRQYAPFGGDPEVAPDPQAQENMLKFAQCMRDNGVESFPDPDGNRLMIDESVGGDPDFQAAQEKCAKEFLPGAVTNGGPGGGIDGVPAGGGLVVGGTAP
jgi:hypothetical protein